MQHLILAEYGHVQLSFIYTKVVTLKSDGLIFKKLHYPWSAITHIDVWQEVVRGAYGTTAFIIPRAKISLSSGKHFQFRGDILVKRGQPLLPGYDTVFNEVVSYLKEQQRLLKDRPHNPHEP